MMEISRACAKRVVDQLPRRVPMLFDALSMPFVTSPADTQTPPPIPGVSAAPEVTVLTKSAFDAAFPVQAERRKALESLAGLLEPKQLVMATPTHVEALNDLASTVPHLQQLMHALVLRIRTQVLGEKPLCLGSLCLHGPAGTGKTYIGRRIGEALSLPVRQLQLAGNGDTIALVGSSRQWHQSGPGEIIRFLANSTVANVLFVFDEVDKCGTSSHGSVEDILLNLFEPENAAQFRDCYVSAPVDLSYASFLCTANTRSRLSGPLQSRLTFIDSPPPTGDAWGPLAESVYTQLLQGMGLQQCFVAALPEEVLVRLIGQCKSVRDLRQRLQQGIELAIMSVNLAEAAPTDLLPVLPEKARADDGAGIGFMAQLSP